MLGHFFVCSFVVWSLVPCTTTPNTAEQCKYHSPLPNEICNCHANVFFFCYFFFVLLFSLYILQFFAIRFDTIRNLTKTTTLYVRCSDPRMDEHCQSRYIVFIYIIYIFHIKSMGKSAAINQKLYVTVVGEHTFLFSSLLFFFFCISVLRLIPCKR